MAVANVSVERMMIVNNPTISAAAESEPAYPTPRWVTVAKKYIGTAEIVGAKENPTILGFWKQAMAKASASVKSWLLSTLARTEETPWCATFAAAVMNEAGIPDPLPNKFYSALEWQTYGINLLRPKHGAIMVFKRTGGGHVGFYLSEDKDSYHIIGGNQSDKVSITRIEKSRLVAIRWPASVDPKPYRGVVLATIGGAISENEA